MTREVEKKSFTELSTERELLVQKYKLYKDNTFKHHSGSKAVVKEIVFDCKTNEPMVVYQFFKEQEGWLEAPSETFCRPLEGFVENFKLADTYGFFTTHEERDKIRKFLAGEI